MDQCFSCDTHTQWSEGGSSSCEDKVLVFFSWRDSFAVVLLVFCGLGLLLVLVVSAVFIRWRATPVVRAAGGPLSQIILFSLAVSFISAVLFVGRPSSLQCQARQVLYGISFTLCVSCVLVKSIRVLLAFHLDLQRQSVLLRFYQPYVLVTVLVALQAVTCICWLLLKSPRSDVIQLPTTLLQYCDEGSYLAFGVMLGYIGLLAFVCFICAFRGRKLPQQYNDARFVTFSMLLYLVSWLIFIPVYITTSGVYLPAVEMVVILISNYGILSCHFLPKCYVILFRSERNTTGAFRKDLYEYSKKHSALASDSSVSQLPSVGRQDNVTVSTCSVLTVGGASRCKDNVIFLGSFSRHSCLRRSISV